ncbi:MAG TPA: H-X9-DG-CTERM domain-containing protein [Blastocatellia bacterium]|nr:H-X9-DG-CTERM domain-containing protein [Blastocatellia bacterium]
MPAKIKAGSPKKRRTRVRELPVAKQALRPKEMKNVRGGLSPDVEQDNFCKQGKKKATNTHSGGVNVLFADGSVRSLG